jgi:hypothetical protein
MLILRKKYTLAKIHILNSLFADLIFRQRVVLFGDGERDLGLLGSASDDDDVLGGRPRPDLVDAKLELQVLVVTRSLVTKKFG